MERRFLNAQGSSKAVKLAVAHALMITCLYSMSWDRSSDDYSPTGRSSMEAPSKYVKPDMCENIPQILDVVSPVPGLNISPYALDPSYLPEVRVVLMVHCECHTMCCAIEEPGIHLSCGKEEEVVERKNV